MTVSPRDISAVILAGGQGRRMGGVDKGLIELNGRPMIAWVLARLAPQVNAIMINANRSVAQYRAFDVPVVEDIEAGYAGPLMGIYTALRASPARWTLIVPCDTPLLPADLVARLAASALNADTAQVDRVGTDIVYARDEARAHPVVALMRTALADDLGAVLKAGERKIDRWYARHRQQAVHFDDPRAFANINSPADRAALLPCLRAP